MEESGTAEIQEANALIIHVNENAEIPREANTSTGNESQNEELHSEANDVPKKGESSPSREEYFIHRVPDDLLNLNKDAYIPKVISIGPYHHFETKENIKESCFDIFLLKASRQREEVVTFIMGRAKEVRGCYDNQLPKLHNNDFVKMIMLDASFIIVIFLISEIDEWRSYVEKENLQINFSKVVRDICLLENQLPFFVIKELYDFASESCPKHYPPDFTKLAFAFFKNYYTSKVLSYQPGNMKPLVGLKIKHLVGDLKIKNLVDLFRTFFLPPAPQNTGYSFLCLIQRNRGKKSMHLNTASQLDERGVKFKVGGPSERFVDFKFRNGVLKLPCLVLDMEIESIFRNLVAMEQYHYTSKAYFANYIRFLDLLINTDKDVDLLVQKRILINNLPDSKAVTTFFNNLGAHITDFDTNPYYYDLCVKLNKYSRNCRHGLIVRFRRDYFSNPWRTASTSAAIILLVLTFIQTVCSIISLRQN